MEGGGNEESKVSPRRLGTGAGAGAGVDPMLAELYQTKHRREQILHSLIASFSALDLVDPQATRVFIEALQEQGQEQGQGQGQGLGRDEE